MQMNCNLVRKNNIKSNIINLLHIRNSLYLNINIKNYQIKSVECETSIGKFTIEGDIFISSMPVKDLVTGFKGERIPKKIFDIANGLPYRDFIFFSALYQFPRTIRLEAAEYRNTFLIPAFPRQLWNIQHTNHIIDG